MSNMNSNVRWGYLFLGSVVVGILGYAMIGDAAKVAGYGLMLGILAFGYAVRWVFRKVTKKSNDAQNSESVEKPVERTPALEAAAPQDQIRDREIKLSEPSCLYCDQCGTASRRGARFCHNCGNNLQA